MCSVRCVYAKSVVVFCVSSQTVTSIQNSLKDPLQLALTYKSLIFFKFTIEWNNRLDCRIVHNSLHTRLIKNWSWDTTTTPPWNLLSAFANASIVSITHSFIIVKPISKWLVGSSITRMCGFVFVIIANDTRVFWPPLRVFTGRSAISIDHSLLLHLPSLTPKRANWLRSTWSSSFG